MVPLEQWVAGIEGTDEQTMNYTGINITKLYVIIVYKLSYLTVDQVLYFQCFIQPFLFHWGPWIEIDQEWKHGEP
jgi:hypothetical protein